MKEEKDAYERLPKTLRDTVELHGRQQGLTPEQVRAEYLSAQVRVNPGSPYWDNDLFKRHRRRKGA